MRVSLSLSVSTEKKAVRSLTRVARCMLCATMTMVYRRPEACASRIVRRCCIKPVRDMLFTEGTGLT